MTAEPKQTTGRQEFIDRFYWSRGAPCCAGCDWWRHLNSVVGKCLRSAPAPDQERWAMIGISGHSLPGAADHIATTRDHSCGEFRDTFDWASLPIGYQRQIGMSQGKRS